MKGALLMYGEMRTFKFLKENFYQKILEGNDIDIFISTHKNDRYNTTDLTFDIINSNYYGMVKKISFLEDYDNTKFINHFFEKIKSLDPDLYEKYNNEIKQIKNMDDFKLFRTKNKLRYLNNKNGIHYLFYELILSYHRYVSQQLLDNYILDSGIKYDYVILFRPDIYVHNKLKFELLDINPNKIYFRVDFMVVSTYENLKNIINTIYMNYYDNILTNDLHDSRYIIETMQTNYICKNFKCPLNILNNLGFEMTYNDDNTYKLVHMYDKLISQEDFDDILKKHKN